jgi:hypothetical protein
LLPLDGLSTRDRSCWRGSVPRGRRRCSLLSPRFRGKAVPIARVASCQSVAVACSQPAKLAGSLPRWGYGATVARLTPDQKVGSSNLSALITHPLAGLFRAGVHFGFAALPICIPAIAQLAEHLTVDPRSDQMVPGSIPGGRIFSSLQFRC